MQQWGVLHVHKVHSLSNFNGYLYLFSSRQLHLSTAQNEALNVPFLNKLSHYVAVGPLLVGSHKYDDVGVSFHEMVDVHLI